MDDAPRRGPRRRCDRARGRGAGRGGRGRRHERQLDSSRASRRRCGRATLTVDLRHAEELMLASMLNRTREAAAGPPRRTDEELAEEPIWRIESVFDERLVTIASEVSGRPPLVSGPSTTPPRWPRCCPPRCSSSPRSAGSATPPARTTRGGPRGGDRGVRAARRARARRVTEAYERLRSTEITMPHGSLRRNLRARLRAGEAAVRMPPRLGSWPSSPTETEWRFGFGEHRFLFIEEDAERAGHAVHTIPRG